MATYDNDLRLKEITTGDEDGTWGVSTNTNLALIADGFSLGTKQMAADANETFTMPDATADATRSLYLKITSAVSLTATREVTLGPNTVSKTWIIENATSGSQIITIKQGSGATVNVPNGSKVMVVTDGAGAGAAVFNANPTELDSVALSSVLATGNTTGGTDLAVSTGDDITFADSSKAIFGAGSDLQIYHDGSASYIDDAGTGNLRIRANSSLSIQKYTGETMGVFTADGSVLLAHDNNTKFETTSTGIDVTGDITLGDTNPTITFNDSSITNLSHTVSSASDNLRLVADVNNVDAGSRVEIFDGSTEVARFSAGAMLLTGTATMDGLTLGFQDVVSFNTTSNSIGNVYLGKINAVAGSAQNEVSKIELGNVGSSEDSGNFLVSTADAGTLKSRALFDYNGDISFYEDTGTTPKFFWDASAERLGIGNSAPATALDVTGTVTANGIRLGANQGAFNTNYDVIELGNAANILGSTTSEALILASNVINTPSGNQYITSDAASRILLNNGTIDFTVASTGTAGDSVSLRSALNIANNGDISFYEDTGTIAKLTWDASAESLSFADNAKAQFGAGNDLQIYHDGSNSYIKEGGTGNLRIQADDLYVFNVAGNSVMISALDTGKVGLGYAGAEKLATTSTGIDVTGNITVGTNDSIFAENNLRFKSTGAAYIDHNTVGQDINFRVSGSTSLDTNAMTVSSTGIDVTGTVTADGLTVDAGRISIDGGTDRTITINNGSGADRFTINNVVASGATSITQTISYLSFVMGASEAMRIDSSGNLLVGKTAASGSTQGAELRADGRLLAVSTSDYAGYFNRKTTDGEIVRFVKDTTTVGSIGNNTDFYIASQDGTGVRFSATQVLPCSETGAIQNGSRDLGSSSGRFKDLYLSGGVYLGGTGAANKLDDYEEGTWTPTVIGSTTAGTATYSQQVGTYTKVGNLCYAQLWVIFSSFTGAGEMRISALPFTPESGSYENHTGSVVLESITLPVGTVQVAPRAFNSQTYLGLTAVKDNDTSSSVDCDSAGQILISITYRTT
jgi:hypothetical protein